MRFDVIFVSEAKLNVEFKELNIIKEHSEEIYDGPLVIDPKYSDQVLQTRGKLMPDDVTVHEIFVSKVSNPSGGKTVYIGV